MRNAGARGIPWLISHRMKKTLVKHSITRMNPRTWVRGSKHMLKWTEMMMGQSTELSALSSLGSKIVEVEKQVWDRQHYRK